MKSYSHQAYWRTKLSNRARERPVIGGFDFRLALCDILYAGDYHFSLAIEIRIQSVHIQFGLYWLSREHTRLVGIFSLESSVL